MPEPTLESRLASWGEHAAPAPDVPPGFARAVRRRRLARLAPPVLTAAALSLLVLACVLIAISPAPRPVQPFPSAHVAPTPGAESLTLLPVTWAPTDSLTIGSCRTPDCVDAWFNGG